jgi:Skp family chaperone for outer membrane proteins
MFVTDPDTTTNVGKLIGGAVVAGGSAWGIIRLWLSSRRTDSVSDARASADVDSFTAYSGTITMLRSQIDQLRQDHEASHQKWQSEMATLDSRLKTMSDQVDLAIARARAAEDIADKLRNQLRAAKLEPCV